MVAAPEVLAIVQARGGSKGLPGKNLSLLGRHPLVAYSIVSGLRAKTVTRLIVSTDDEEIADVSRQYGAEVPFMRPAELATDDATDYPLIEHALDWLQSQQGYQPKIIVQLRPTTPLRPQGLIDEAVGVLLDDPTTDCARGVTPSGQNPYKMWRLGSDNNLQPLLESDVPEPYNMPRQKLPPTYWQTGHVDAIAYETIVRKHSLTGDRIKAVMVEPQYCIDIDSQRDIDLANWILGRGGLDIDFPSVGPVKERRLLPKVVDLVVFDFDGVFTDNRVWVTEDGKEAVACHRGDGMGLALLKERGIVPVVLSSESNPVVAARCCKLGVECQQSLGDKGAALRNLVQQKGLDMARVVYVGNDVNDLDCMMTAGYAVAVADAHPTVLSEADLVLQTSGGYGAVRELCDLVIKQLEEGQYAESH